LVLDTRTKLIESGIIKKSTLKKGVNRVRLVFIISSKGNIKAKKILGNLPKAFTNKLKEIIGTLTVSPQFIQEQKYQLNTVLKFTL